MKRAVPATLLVGLWAVGAGMACRAPSVRPELPPRPNIVLLMADDLGWGDVGFQGNEVIATPHLDAMASAGLVLSRFYAAAPVCSPTRGSVLTGRHPYRYGIKGANAGHLPVSEPNLAGILRAQGYRTGHFGKWHLGTLTRKVKESNRGGPRGVKHYAPPWERHFDVCFSTEAKTPTFDPMKKPGTDETYGTHYWVGEETRETENLEGDDSRVIMDRVVPFVRDAVERGQPFLAVVWFHAPHLPVVAGPRHRGPYEHQPGLRPDYYGCITALDEQVGRLRAELRSLGVQDNTLLWFCSDNGPEGKTDELGRTGPFRGRKRSLYEGGVRVPALVEWPDVVEAGRTSDYASTTTDTLPTILEILQLPMPRATLDGRSLAPLLRGAEVGVRPGFIAFESGGRLALTEHRYKLTRPGKDREFELYDLLSDPGESEDLAAVHPERLRAMQASLEDWRSSVRNR